MLDTNALSAFADGDPALRLVIEREIELSIPVIVLGEYLFGIRQSRQHSRYQDWLKRHLGVFSVVLVDADTARYYAEVWTELRSSGKPIPSNDVWIAALARQHHHSLVSRDRHFEAVRGLPVITW